MHAGEVQVKSLHHIHGTESVSTRLPAASLQKDDGGEGEMRLICFMLQIFCILLVSALNRAGEKTFSSVCFSVTLNVNVCFL